MTPGRLAVLALMTILPAAAQNTSPHAGYVYPAGARQGSTIQVRVGGQFLTGATKALLSGEGIEAKVVRHYKPPNGAEAQKLRDEVREITAKGRANLTPADRTLLEEIRERLEDWQRLPSIPAIAELVTLELTIAPEAKPGVRHLRLDTTGGLTNPIQFVVGTLPEFTRKPARLAMAYNVVNGATPVIRTTPAPAEAATEITLPAICNGQMMPATTDRYRFHAAKGDRLRIAAAARELMPYLSDAVPGWFQAAVTLRDARGRELISADHDEFRPDPLVRYVIPEDGDYTAEIHDSIYRGREDFVYRLAISPDSAPAATKLAKRPTKLKLPATVRNALTRAGEVHRFRIDGKAGDELVAEVTARRSGSPLDSTLRLTDAKGRELVANDDFEDKAAGLLTHQADSYLSFRLPAKGTYYLELADGQGHAGPGFTYSLRVSRPQPDFELRVVPASLNVRAGSTVPVTVYALRRDGFSGDIALSLNNSAAKFVLSGAKIPAGQDKIRITLSAPPSPSAEPYVLELTGRATIAGRDRTHAAIPADEMEQAFAWRHLVAQDVWMVRLLGTGNAQQAPVRPVESTLKLWSGDRTRFTVPIPSRQQNGLKVALNEPPDGIVIESCTPVPAGLAVVISVQAEKAKPGLKGNLILEAYRETGQQQQPNRPRNRQRLALLPAIPFEVVAGPPSPGAL